MLKYPEIFFKQRVTTQQPRPHLLTGGLFNQSEGCMPYAVEPCDRSNKTRSHVENEEERPLCGPDVPTPKCQRQCRNGYNSTFKGDKHFGFQVYEVVPKVHLLNGQWSGAWE